MELELAENQCEKNATALETSKQEAAANAAQAVDAEAETGALRVQVTDLEEQIADLTAERNKAVSERFDDALRRRWLRLDPRQPSVCGTGDGFQQGPGWWAKAVLCTVTKELGDNLDGEVGLVRLQHRGRFSPSARRTLVQTTTEYFLFVSSSESSATPNCR